MRDSIGSRIVEYPATQASLSAVTSLPFLVFITLTVSFVFAALSLLFAIALLL
jgi:hypothetical protein